MPLYHYSEDPTIRKFAPRAPLAHPDSEPLVYAIDEEHSPLYFVPRECPRVCYWPLPTTTQEDRERWFGQVAGRMVIAIEFGWLPRLRETRLYRYRMPEEGFIDVRDHGVHVSRQPVTPLEVEPLGDLLERMRAADVELRLCPSLAPLGEAIIQASLHFSLIRMRNAQGWTGDTGSPAVPL